METPSFVRIFEPKENPHGFHHVAVETDDADFRFICFREKCQPWYCVTCFWAGMTCSHIERIKEEYPLVPNDYIYLPEDKDVIKKHVQYAIEMYKTYVAPRNKALFEAINSLAKIDASDLSALEKETKLSMLREYGREHYENNPGLTTNFQKPVFLSTDFADRIAFLMWESRKDWQTIAALLAETILKERGFYDRAVVPVLFEHALNQIVKAFTEVNVKLKEVYESVENDHEVQKGEAIQKDIEEFHSHVAETEALLSSIKEEEDLSDIDDPLVAEKERKELKKSLRKLVKEEVLKCHYVTEKQFLKRLNQVMSSKPSEIIRTEYKGKMYGLRGVDFEEIEVPSSMIDGFDNTRKHEQITHQMNWGVQKQEGEYPRSLYETYLRRGGTLEDISWVLYTNSDLKKKKKPLKIKKSFLDEVQLEDKEYEGESFRLGLTIPTLFK